METAEREVLLVVEDDASYRAMLTTVLSAEGRDVAVAATASEARAALSSRNPAVVLLDLGLPDDPDRSLLGELRRHDPAPLVLVLTGRGDERTVIDAMQQGALEYVVKPVRSERLASLVDRAFRSARAQRAAGETPAPSPDVEGLLVGRTPCMVEVFSLVGRLSSSDVPVLITGESGTGKELVARALHLYGPRAHGPFVAVDCASLPATLLESELFGVERGAYTGAVSSRAGKFESADGGTVFLDEIGNLPVDLQSRLLRALQEKTVQRLGSNTTVKWNARVVSATNAPVRDLVSQGKFREDLFFRLAGAEISIPPLRDRREDIPRLAERFLARMACDAGVRFSPDALRALCVHDWPGNVRELEHVVTRAMAMARTTVIGPEALPALVKSSEPLGRAGVPAEEGRKGLISMDAMKRRYARHALDACGGNRSEAARALDIDRSTLSELVKEG